MTVLTRRNAMLGTAAAAVLGPVAASTPVSAAAPAVGKQNGGWYRYKVGDIEVTAVTDGRNYFKYPDNFVINVSRDQVNAQLEAVHGEKDMMTVPYTPIVVNTAGKIAVIDTGQGERAFETSKGATGQFQNNLKAAGIERDKVDLVIISHFHGDHINGLLDANNKLAYPNAEVLVPDVEWKYFMDDAEMGKQTTERMKGVFANARRVFDTLQRKVTQYSVGKEIAPGITPVATYGHTPGHVSYTIASGNSKVFVQSDVTNTPLLFARKPGWHVFFDQIPDMAEATRRKVYDMLVSEKMLVQGFHYPFPALAYIEKTSDGYRETLVPWNPTI